MPRTPVVTTLARERRVVDAETPARLRATVGQLARRLNAAARGTGMTPSQLSTLGVVARQGPLRMTELAEIEAANPTMLSRVVAALDEQGLVRRRPDPLDRRAGLVEVTARGRRTYDTMRADRGKQLLDGLATLDAEQVAAIETALPALEALARAVSQRTERTP